MAGNIAHLGVFWVLGGVFFETIYKCKMHSWLTGNIQKHAVDWIWPTGRSLLREQLLLKKNSDDWHF